MLYTLPLFTIHNYMGHASRTACKRIVIVSSTFL